MRLLEQATKLERAGTMFITALFAQLTELLTKNQRAWNAFGTLLVDRLPSGGYAVVFPTTL